MKSDTSFLQPGDGFKSSDGRVDGQPVIGKYSSESDLEGARNQRKGEANTVLILSKE
jgi:hypothetical protein